MVAFFHCACITQYHDGKLSCCDFEILFPTRRNIRIISKVCVNRDAQLSARFYHNLSGRFSMKEQQTHRHNLSRL